MAWHVMLKSREYVGRERLHTVKVSAPSHLILLKVSLALRGSERGSSERVQRCERELEREREFERESELDGEIERVNWMERERE